MMFSKKRKFGIADPEIQIIYEAMCCFTSLLINIFPNVYVKEVNGMSNES